jgi:hypothetical protein
MDEIRNAQEAKINTYSFSLAKHDSPLGRPESEWQANTSMGIKGTACNAADWFHMSRDRFHLPLLGNFVMNSIFLHSELVTTTARQMAPAVTLVVYILEVSVSNPGHDTNHLKVLCFPSHPPHKCHNSRYLKTRPQSAPFHILSSSLRNM